MEIELKQIRADDTLGLRQDILWPDHPISHVKVKGDENALHIGAFAGGMHIGVGSFFYQGAQVQLRKLAVRPEIQGHGVGSRIVRFGAHVLRGQDINTLWCDARVSATGFYSALGFEIDPEVFLKSGVAYQKAIWRLGA
ncbi:MAG: GNAT family N-acetyltransferase [Halocynthiibacter sp.]